MPLLFRPDEGAGGPETNVDPPQDGSQRPPDSGDPAAQAPGAGASTDGKITDEERFRVLGDPETQEILGEMVNAINEGADDGAQAPAADPAIGVAPTGNLAELQAKAEAGDPEAAVQLVQAQKEARAASAVAGKAQSQARGATITAILDSPDVKALGDVARGKLIAAAYQGGEAGLAKALLEVGVASVANPGKNGDDPGGGDPPERGGDPNKTAAMVAAGQQVRDGTPSAPGATNPGGPGPPNLDPEQGELKSVPSLWDDWFAESEDGPAT